MLEALMLALLGVGFFGMVITAIWEIAHGFRTAKPFRYFAAMFIVGIIGTFLLEN